MASPKIDYQKRKNKELFKQFETNAFIGLESAQNYIPVYDQYFNLNETNYNNINLNHKWHLSKIEASINSTKCFKCVLEADSNANKTKNVFFKMAPLLDPYKYMSGKYETISTLSNLPSFNKTDAIHPKLLEPNNSSYVDGLFYYLSNRALEQGFIHGIEYYGSFLGIKNDFTFNIIDDIEYLATSDFFNKNNGVLFHTQDYSELLNDENESVRKRQCPIVISEDVALLDIEDLLEEDNYNVSSTETIIDLEEVSSLQVDAANQTSLKSESSCSSRTSHTNSKDSVMSDSCDESDYSIEEEEEEESKEEKNKEGDNGAKEKGDVDGETSEYEDVSSSSGSYSFEEEEDDVLNATIPKFPVQMIAIEHCNNTFDNLIRTNKLTNEEWFSALMQIVMILLTYQKMYSMTHNDLHTNNVMFVHTEKKHLYYCFNKTHYKVPTFGRIFKIIDFGRAIYKFNEVLFCSDSFQAGGDASTQYNTEPFLNGRKPRLDPNYSFDLCRLACSIFDYVIRDMREVKEKCETNAVARVITEWCLDDNGINVLYKNSGAERYPEFKLYKMIARHVHKHTPQAQLERPEFAKFSIQKQNIKRGEPVMVLDNYM